MPADIQICDALDNIKAVSIEFHDKVTLEDFSDHYYYIDKIGDCDLEGGVIILEGIPETISEMTVSGYRKCLFQNRLNTSFNASGKFKCVDTIVPNFSKANRIDKNGQYLYCHIELYTAKNVSPSCGDFHAQ